MENSAVIPVLLACGVVTLSLFLRSKMARSSLENIPGPPSPSMWTGNLRQLMDRHGWNFHKEIALNYGSVVKLSGFLNRPFLYVFDPAALNSIILKDQNVYEEKHAFISTNSLIFGPGLLSTLGDHHRKQRKLLNPVFSINHMRYMLPIFYRVIQQLRLSIYDQVSVGPQEVDVLGWMGRTALELVGQGGLGYSFDTLTETVPPNTLGDAIKSLLPTLSTLDTLQRASPYFSKLGSAGFRRWIMELIPHKKIQRMKSVVDTMNGAAAAIFDEKKKALKAGDEAVLQQIGEGKDIMSILMRENMNADDGEMISEYELISHMSTLIFAAMDTTSNSLSRILHILATRPEVQEKLRQEIVKSRDGAVLAYDDLMKLPFLDAVCRETLRLHPPAPIILREARKDIVMPLSAPIRGRDGTMIHEILVPKDTDIFVGVEGSNWNKALWGEDALEWKPERWLSPLPKAVVDARIPGVYSSLMTFLGGGRACIGFKFSELEMKAVLCTLLPSFSFELPKGDIVWNMAGVNYPTMDDGSQPQMLLRVSALGGSPIARA